MFAQLVRAFRRKVSTNTTTAKLRCELLEDRTVPDGDPGLILITAPAVDFTVNTADDTTDANPNDGKPEDVNGNVSLRSVIEHTNQMGNIRTGDWATNKYTVSFAVPSNRISLTSGPLPQLKSNFNFLGNGVTVERPADSQGQLRLFDIPVDTVSRFENMTFQNGMIINEGGAIRNMGELRIESCTFINNLSFNGGGAIFSGGGSKLNVTTSFFWLNTTKGAGGAIAILQAQTAIISSSTFSVNMAPGTMTAVGHGGAIYVENTESLVLDQATSFIGNEASGEGGGIFVKDSGLTMTGGSFQGNNAGGYGGGIYVDARDKTVTLNQVSVTYNSAGGKGGGAYVWKGALAGTISTLTNNVALGGIAGVGYKKDQGTAADLTVPDNQQLKEQDP